MIADALDFVRGELKAYIDNNLPAGISVNVQIENIANLETDSNNLEDSVLISLVNVEEESSFKNVRTYRKNNLAGKVDYINPPVFVNLYVLFSCSLSVAFSNERYRNALTRLGLIIQFFQSKRCFTLKNSPNSFLSNLPDEKSTNDFKLIMDIYTLTFEQINHLWGSLGGKQVPFVMYKMRLVKIQDEQVQKVGGLITKISTKEEIY